MKSILYVGATLMIGASIYGFVDYKNTSQQKEFSSMYAHEKKAPVVTEEKIITEPAEKGLVAKKQTTAKDEKPVAVKENKEVKKTSAPVAKKAKKKKKLDHRIFSRAPLREDIEEDVKLPVPPKAEEKKIENKEQ